MAPTAPALAVETRLCPYCGKPVAVRLNRCPACREEIQDVRPAGRAFGKEGREKMRRGLLYILLAAIIHYFAAGYSGIPLPVAVPAFVTTVLTPLLFLGGVVYELYGVYLYMRS
ncbi:MAG TPA: hypothetical protein VEI54_08205 [Candidatus Limnocylindrales bacterium]|nr:hypothetical protein [Candidatus Limnocylindrales bacterium]